MWSVGFLKMETDGVLAVANRFGRSTRYAYLRLSVGMSDIGPILKPPSVERPTCGEVSVISVLPVQ
jgi:hypothetical protein